MDQLPNEMLLLIGKHIQQSYCPQSTLHSLSLCCRRFHDVFSPLMYSYISSDTFSKKFIHFIMRIWRQPKLARQVHRLDLCWTQCDQNDPVEMDNEMGSFIEGALDEIFPEEEREQRELWKEHLYGEGLCAEAWLGLLLVRLNNLQIIEFGHEHSDLISDILLKAAKRQQPFHRGVPFPHLEEVRACVNWGASWIDSDFLTPFFYFPAVRRIYGTAIGEKKDDDSLDLNIHQSSCPVRDITVEEGYWCRGMLDWLALCTGLEQISICVEIQADEYEIDDEEAFNAADFHAAILPFVTTLKALRICYGDVYRDRLGEMEAVETPFGSFKAFTVLEQLTVRHDHLMRLPCDHNNHSDVESLSESLPHSLVSLEVIDVMIDHHLPLRSELSKLVLQRRDFVHLQQITLCIQSEDEEGLNGMFDSLKLECQAAGITLKIA
jgi:hypothetical protein